VPSPLYFLLWLIAWCLLVFFLADVAGVLH
jgi:hypothetical protein